MASEIKADHHPSQCPKNLFQAHFNSNSKPLSAQNVLQLLLVLVLCTTNAAFSQSIVRTLPGYIGDLPFKLETGYVSVGQWNEGQLFYYFIESEGNPREDPLLLWLTGGPGCSVFSGLVYEIGPLSFDTQHFDGNFPNFTLNPYSWTKVASIIFLDAPVGTGFSYAANTDSYFLDDLVSATDTYNFLMKWLVDHPAFLSNQLYIAGDSYSGIVVPIIVQKIYDGNSEVGVQPRLKLQGYILGNPLTSQHDDVNARVEFAHRVALLSDKLYESTKHHCHGEYVTVDPNNAPCIKDLANVTECLRNIDTAQILEPNCAFASKNSSKLKWDRRLIEEDTTHFLLPPLQLLSKFWCRIYGYLLSYTWANDPRVQQALHVRKGTKDRWARCNESLSYTEDVVTSIDYLRNLSHTHLRALVYSGDHDLTIPYLGTHKWIESLGLTVDDEWRPWFVDGQNGGYTMSYANKGFHLTFATIKGAGHTAPEYRPKEALAMIERTLPGYIGDLPFKLETGYVSVGQWNEVQLFYYFIESEGNPREDPLLLWLTGGPGCSAFSGLVYEIGPLKFDTEHFDGKFPNFTLNPYSWTKVASIIFLDAPVGTGFSYNDDTTSTYFIDDLLAATDNYNFLIKWLADHPTFLSNQLYIAGDSYSGIIVPIIVQKIYDGNSEVGVQPQLKLQGYILGNPLTSQHDDVNARVDFVHRVALLSDNLYQSTKKNCHGEYVDVDPNNAPCIKDLANVTECLRNIYQAQILEPNCAIDSKNSSKLKWDRRLIQEEPTDYLLPPLQLLRKFWCREYNYVLSYIWANDARVQQALHIRKGTKDRWARCNDSLSYTEDVVTSIDYHRNLSHTYLRALIYSGDHDSVVPYVGTHKWIESLGLPVEDEWRPWFVDGQNGGYTMRYVKRGYRLTFATIKGGGHTAPEYKPKEALAMIERWLAFFDL